MLADDHPFIVFGLREMLGKRLGFNVVAEATGPRLLLEKLARIECDVLITDFSMPCADAPDGLALLHCIRTRFPNVRIVVLTMLDNPGLLGCIRKAGALALLNKRDGLQELSNAVIAAFQGREHLSASVRQALARLGAGNPEAVASSRLSPREIEVLRLYVGGMTTSDIARYLNRSINTVSTQKHSAMRKIGVKNDAELYDYAIEHGLKA
ncbi:response regulator transcription factor [Cupriavidus sp. D384]|uniref:response regulator transcription factor n=1 Tax=Cupriavidus sp. D384 TaxID=1538095 RepID=UPI0009EE0D03|nr:response regulator transcription factor [Cupriavidus sp. D384]